MNMLMLTKFFPFGTGEAFIENEIKELAKYYEKIVIIACEVPKFEFNKRTVPDNVVVFRVPADKKGHQTKKDIVAGIPLMFSKILELKNEYGVCKGLKQRAFLGYFEAKSQRIFKHIMNQQFLLEVGDKPYVLYSYWLFMTARVGVLISEKKKPEYMFSRSHRYDLYEERNDLNYLPYRKHFLEKFDLVIPCSDNGTQYLQEKYPLYAAKIQTAFLGTLDQGIGKHSTDGIFRLISCSRIASEKRVSRIVDALSLIDGQIDCIEWIHIGDGKEFDDLKQQAACKLHNIKYKLLGNLPNCEVLAYYMNNPLDLFVNVSSSEGLPVSIMEAISFGIPVVATDVGGTSEIVVNGYTGQLIQEHFTDEELANIILMFVKYKFNDVYLNYSKQCRSSWEKHFQASKNYNELCMFLEKQVN